MSGGKHVLGLKELYLNKHYLTHFLPKIKEYTSQGKKRVKYDKFEDGDIACELGYTSLIKERGLHMYFSSRAMDLAAKWGHLEIVIWLHENTEVGCSTFAMDWAASNGHLHVVKWLHQNRKEGCTTKAMNKAAKHGHFDTLVWLGDNRSGGFSLLAFDAACANGDLGMMKWLYDQKNSPVPSLAGANSRPINLAAGNGDLEVLKWLKEKGYNPTANAVDEAARKGHLHVLQWLNREFHIKKYYMALMYVATNGDMEIAKWLVENFEKRDPSLEADAAAAKGHLDMLKWMLLDLKLTCSTIGIREAAREGQLETLRWLDKNQEIDFSSPELALSAAFGGHREVLEWLHTEKKISVAIPTIVDEAAKNGHVHILEWLLEHQSALGTPQALNKASINGSLATVKWLVKQGYEVRDTAMDFAAQSNHLEVFKFMHETSGMCCSYFGAEKAAFRGYLEIVKYIVEKNMVKDLNEIYYSALKEEQLKIVFWLRSLKEEKPLENDFPKVFSKCDSFSPLKGEYKITLAENFGNILKSVLPLSPFKHIAQLREEGNAVVQNLLSKSGFRTGESLVGFGERADTTNCEIYFLGHSFQFLNITKTGYLTFQMKGEDNQYPKAWIHGVWKKQHGTNIFRPFWLYPFPQEKFLLLLTPLSL